LVLLAANAGAQTVTTNFYSQTVNAVIPDENPNGYNTAIQVSNVVGTIQGISISLNITNGYNGDLYAYLVNPEGTQAILLNRTGISSSNSFGYGDAGFDIQLNAFASNNIHFYQTYSFGLNSGGQLTGTWAADGRNIDPNSPPSAFDSAATDSNLTSFFGSNPNGDWTLFIADLNGAYQSTLLNWGIEIETVPEPSTLALLAVPGVLLAGYLFRRSAKRNTNG